MPKQRTTSKYKFKNVTYKGVSIVAHGVKYAVRVNRSLFSLEVFKGRTRLEHGVFRHPAGGIDYELSDSQGRIVRIKTRHQRNRMISEITKNDKTRRVESDAAEHGLRLAAAFPGGRGPVTPYIKRFLVDLQKDATFRRELTEKSQFQLYVDGDAGLVICGVICAMAVIQPELLPACILCMAEAPIGFRPGAPWRRH